MKCSYCNNNGHSIFTCNLGLELQELFNSTTIPEFSKLKLKQLRRLVCLRNRAFSNKNKQQLVELLNNLWYENEKKRTVVYDNTSCVICMGPMFSNNLTVLSCGHKYHFYCIAKWCSRKLECPVCKSHIRLASNLFDCENSEDDEEEYLNQEEEDDQINIYNSLHIDNEALIETTGSSDLLNTIIFTTQLTNQIISYSNFENLYKMMIYVKNVYNILQYRGYIFKFIRKVVVPLVCISYFTYFFYQVVVYINEYKDQSLELLV